MSSWLEKMQDAPVEKRKRTIYIIVGLVAVILLGLWALIGNPNTPKSNNSGNFIQDVNQSIKETQETIKNPMEK